MKTPKLSDAAAFGLGALAMVLAILALCFVLSAGCVP